MSRGNDKCVCVVCICVCAHNTKKNNCTYGMYTSCPGAETPEVLLHNELDDMTIAYKQWVTTDQLS
jgi:hypothetical protein